MATYSPFFCEKIKRIAIQPKAVINAPETSQHRQEEAALGVLIWKEQHLNFCYKTSVKHGVPETVPQTQSS